MHASLKNLKSGAQEKGGGSIRASAKPLQQEYQG